MIWIVIAPGMLAAVVEFFVVCHWHREWLVALAREPQSMVPIEKITERQQQCWCKVKSETLWLFADMLATLAVVYLFSAIGVH